MVGVPRRGKEGAAEMRAPAHSGPPTRRRVEWKWHRRPALRWRERTWLDFTLRNVWSYCLAIFEKTFALRIHEIETFGSLGLSRGLPSAPLAFALFDMSTQSHWNDSPGSTLETQTLHTRRAWNRIQPRVTESTAAMKKGLFKKSQPVWIRNS